MTVQAPGAPLTRVAVHLGARRLDVALDAARTLGELLAAAGVPLVPGLLALDSSGRALDLAAPVAEQVADGAVVHVVAPAPRPRGRAARARAEWVARRPDPQPALLGAAAATSGVLAAVALIDPVARGWLALAAALVLGVAALVLAVVPVAAATAATLAAPVLGFAAGVAAVDPAGSADRRLALVAGLVAATAAAAVRWVATRAQRQGQDVAGVVVVAVGVVAALALAVLLAGLPGVVAAAALLGLTPVGLRALPVLALSVPDEQLVDLAHVARTAPSVRGPRPRGLGRVNERQVVRTVGAAERRTDAGVLLVCAVPPVLVPVVLAAALGDPLRGTLRGWAAVALVAALVAVLALQPRTARGPVARWAPRVAAGLVLLELAVLGGPRVGADAVLLAVGCVVVALAAAAIGLALGRGWRSVVASRFGDFFEGLGVVLALPAALVAADLVETLRRVTS
ncbi:hypothetical protein [Cellulomonas pakistanensis]|uniref:hypothetical protein n=1 Tax=Cellulomonas pakistanensis TaxID=992287 RepID=UPI00194230E1|nr:hypothetical protein [Cellulomonas pakistanensis]